MKVRVTHLEAYRRLLDWSEDESALRRALSGQEDPPNELMRRGTVWHALLAGQTVAEPVCDFAEEDLLWARAGLVGGLCEMEGRARVGPLDVVGHCDWIRGLTVQDHKAKWTTPDPRAYEQSLQWRFYLLLFDAQVFQYNLFHFAEPKEGMCRLKEVVSFRFYRYPGLEEECRQWCQEFYEWFLSPREIAA